MPFSSSAAIDSSPNTGWAFARPVVKPLTGTVVSAARIWTRWSWAALFSTIISSGLYRALTSTALFLISGAVMRAASTHSSSRVPSGCTHSVTNAVRSFSSPCCTARSTPVTVGFGPR